MTTNHVSSEEQTRKGTRASLVKIPNVTCLYRHSVTGIYYGIKKLRNKRKREHSLGTADRKIGERKLATWLKGLASLDTESEKSKLGQLIKKWVACRKGNGESTTGHRQFYQQKIQGGLKTRLEYSRLSNQNVTLG